MSLKILYSHVAMTDYPRGLFFRTFGFARELAKRGHDVTFIATQYHEFVFPWKIEHREGVKIVSFPSIMPVKVRWLGYAPLPILLRMIYLLNKEFDIYHCDHHRPASFFSALAGKLFNGGKVLVEWMDYMGKGSQYDNKKRAWKITVGPFDNYLEIKSNNIADGVIVISEYLRESTIDEGVPPEHIVKVWGASDVEVIDFVEDKIPLRGKYELPKDNFIVNLANMTESEIENYYPYITGFFEKVSSERSVSVIKTGANSSKLTQLCDDLGIRLFQLGGVSYQKYCDLLTLSDCYILFQEESLREISRWPNVIGDFLAAGNPTLILPVGDARVAAEEYPFAFSCIESLETLDESIDELYKLLDTDNRKKIRQLAEEEFSWQHRGETLERFYNRILLSD